LQIFWKIVQNSRNYGIREILEKVAVGSKGCLLVSKVIAFKVRSSLSLPWLSVFSPYT